jgi:type II secretory pathway pseudopilin PulG
MVRTAGDIPVQYLPTSSCPPYRPYANYLGCPPFFYKTLIKSRLRPADSGMSCCHLTAGIFPEEEFMERSERQPKYTLAELLIVTAILGTLAAIVVPEFSHAGALSKTADLDRSVEVLRSEIGKYRIEHNDTLPGTRDRGFDTPTFWAQLTTATDDTGRPFVAGVSRKGPFGPYLQQIPDNPLCPIGSAPFPAVRDGITDPPSPSPGTRFYFNFADGTGKLWAAVDMNGTAGD